MTRLSTNAALTALLACVLASPVAAQTPDATSPCTVYLDIDNSLGNFEIQILKVDAEAASVGGRNVAAESHTVQTRVASKARGSAQFPLGAGCVNGRRLKVTPRKDSGDAHLDYLLITLENCGRSSSVTAKGPTTMQCRASYKAKP